MFFFYCIPSSSYSKEDLFFWQFWKIINVTWILERYIGMVHEKLFRARISSLFIGIYSRVSHSQVCCVETRGLVCFWRNERLNWSILVSFFFRFYGSLQSCLHHFNTQGSKWLNTTSRNGFLWKELELATDFSFWGRLNPSWLGHWDGSFKTLLQRICSTHHFLSRSFELVLPGEFGQKLGIRELQLALFDWTFAEQLIVYDIPRLCWMDADLYE